MLFFTNDYGEGAHPKILEALAKTNMEQLSGYGTDKYCEAAKKKIADFCHCPEAQVHFLTGGTQTNQIVIDTVITKYEGVIAATTGHVSLHEAGAIEFSGHKVITLPEHNGKLSPQDVKQYLQDFYADANHEHMAQPGMVYISHPTEYGTLYSNQELSDLHDVCQEYHIPLFLDGARLGYGLMSEGSDVTAADIAELTDVFYIGGTKVGALCGEAVVFTKNNTPKAFITSVKQHGALLAKGRLLGVQFDTLFTDDLYLKISENAIKMAAQIKKALKDKGYQFYIDSPTNQIFVVWENSKLPELEKHVAYGFWEKYDDTHTVIRFATSWATTQEAADGLIALL